MTEWIMIVLSVLALTINIVTQRDQLSSFFNALKSWKSARVERQKALAAIHKFSTKEIYNSALKLNLSSLAFYLPIFLISVPSSGALGYLGQQPNFSNTFLLSGGTYLSIAMIVSITFLVTYQRAKWQAILALIVTVFMISALWGIFVLVIEYFGLRMMWSGILAGMIMTAWLWILN